MRIRSIELDPFSFERFNQLWLNVLWHKDVIRGYTGLRIMVFVKNLLPFQKQKRKKLDTYLPCVCHFRPKNPPCYHVEIRVCINYGGAFSS